MQISKYNYKDSLFPDLLREIPSPPKQLFVLGDIPTGPAVAIIGSRQPTDYGRQITYQLAGELAQAGLVIVSGLARGLDGVAHLAAVEAGGLTVAVQACGLDQVYPASNRGLAKQILASGGAIISEYPVGTQPLRQNFVARNRLESGLSLGVVITEAAAASGTLLTANFALNQNRVVMAVPGNITSPLSAGPNNLLRSGAVPVTSASDVLAAIGYAATNPQLSSINRAKSPEEAEVFRLLEEGITSSQAIIEHSQLSASQFAQVISLMEITGKVRNLGAGQWVVR